MPEAIARCAAVNAAGAKRSQAIGTHHTAIDSQAPHRCHSYLAPFPPWLQIAQHLEASPSGSSWYAAPAPAPEFTSVTGSDGVSEPAFRGLGADDAGETPPKRPKYTALGSGHGDGGTAHRSLDDDDNAIPFPDVELPPWPCRMGALG